jgi:hypothetical protein
MSRFRRHLVLSLFAILVGSLLASCALAAGNADPKWPGRPFAASSFWNKPLGAHAPLAPYSGDFVAALVRQVDQFHPWMNTTSYSIPVYVVPRHQRTVHVTLDTWGPDLQKAFDDVPVPRNAHAAAGTDGSMTVWQPSQNRLWDFWQMHKVHGRWHARWGGEMTDVSRNPGYFIHSGQTSGWGATATGLPLLGGLVTFADLKRGYINHALAMALPETQYAKYSWPAQRTDGNTWSPGIFAIPEGMRFRLNPHINIASLHLPKIDQMLAQAAQRYGIVVRDKADAVVFYGQDPVTQSTNPWPAAFDNQVYGTALEQFPWSHLQALAPRMACCF